MLYYREQKQLICRRCLGIGHKTENCKNEEVCLTCKKPGHRKADGKCEGILGGKQRQNGPWDKMGDGPLEDGKKFIKKTTQKKKGRMEKSAQRLRRRSSGSTEWTPVRVRWKMCWRKDRVALKPLIT
ncbi:hypothetical protein ElyMa_000099500 [Elysia marginata]|uniref:Uncharacterized protein n=1 Tax=Elysia marginata TaxID=1093978 RepID=A0AAV4EKM9_9GAST|nr:hypothetical protein ElyMa_000099500 [Elysia marginata]